MKSKNTKIVQ